MANYSDLEMEAALCVWETINDWTLTASTKEDWKALRDNVGSAELRGRSAQIGQWCLAVYDICTAHNPDFFDGAAYDWEVIPMIMGQIDVNPETTETTLPLAEQTALLVAREYLFGEYLAECGREANRQWSYSALVTDHIEKTEQSFAIDQDPREFVQWLGEKYDLTPVNEWLRP